MSLTATPGLNGGGGTFGSGAGILGGRLLGNQFGIVAIGVDAGASNLLRRIGALATITGERTGMAASGMQAFSGALRSSTIILGATIGAIGAATVIVNDFNETIAKTAGILNEEVDDVMESVGMRAIELSKQFAFSAAEIADAGKQLAQAGLSLQEVETALESVTAFATVVGGDFTKTVNLAVRVMNGFKLEAEDLNDVLNSLTFIINTSPVVISDLEAAFKQLTPVTAQLGVSLESTAAAIAAVSRAGLAGSTGGTSLASGLIQLLAPSKQVQDNFGDLIGTFKATLQETGDLSIAMDAFLRSAGSNIEEFSATIDDLRNNEGLEAFTDLSDGALEELGTRFEIINILLEILGTRSAKGFLDFAANAEQARIDTLALQLGLSDFRESAEKSIQNINDQLKILRNNLAAPFLEGDFAESLTAGLEALNSQGLGKELAESFSSFAEEGLGTLLDLLPTFVDLLGIVTGALVSLGGFLDFAAGIAEVFAGALNSLGGVGGELLITYLLVSKVFGQLIGGMVGLTTQTGQLVASKIASNATTKAEIANIQALNGAMLMVGATHEERIVDAQRDIATRQQNITFRAKEIQAIDLTIAKLGQESARRKELLFSDENKNIRNRIALKALDAQATDLSNRREALSVAIKQDHNFVMRQQEFIQSDLTARTFTATSVIQTNNLAREFSIKTLIKENVIKGKSILLQNALNLAFFAGFGAVLQLSQGNEVLGFTLAAVATGLVAYRTAMFLADLATKGLVVSNVLLQVAMNPFVGAGIAAAVTATFIALSLSLKGTASKFDDATVAAQGFGREMKKLFPEQGTLDIQAESIVQLGQETNEDGDIERTVQINFKVDEAGQELARDQLQQLRDAGVDVTVGSADLVQSDFEGRIAAFEQLLDDVEKSGVDLDEDALLENIFGNNADLVRSIIEGEIEGVDFSARVTNLEIEDKEKVRGILEEALTVKGTIFGLGPDSEIGGNIADEITARLAPLEAALAAGEVTTEEALAIANEIKAGIEEDKPLLDNAVVFRVNGAVDKAIQALEEAELAGEQLLTATGTVTDTIVEAVEDIPTVFDQLKENFGKLLSPLNNLITAFEGVVKTNDQYSTTFSQVTSDLDLTAKEAVDSLEQLKKVREIVETIQLVDSIQGIFEDIGKDIPAGVAGAFDSLVGSLEQNLGVFDTLFGSVDETSKLFELINASGGFIDFSQAAELGASLKRQTIQLTNGLEVPTTAFAEMSDAGFNVARALEEFGEFTLRNQVFEITSSIVSTLKTLGLSTGDRIFDSWVQTQVEVANQMLSVGDNLVDIFDPANFDPNTLVELWAQALESPRFEQNNNIIVRVSGDTTTEGAVSLADNIVTQLRNQGVAV